MKYCLIFLVLSILHLGSFQKTHAQIVEKSLVENEYFKAKPGMAVLLPLFLDSAFADGKYKYGNQLPGFLLNGLEFYNGLKIASQALEEKGIPSRIRILDISKPDYFSELFKDSATEETGLVISVAQTAAEFRAIAEKLKPSGMPLVSLLPNDAGVTDYPNLFIANPTLRTHCKKLYKFVQRNFSIDNLVLLTPPGSIESRLKNYLKESDNFTASVKLDWKEIALTMDSTEAAFVKVLDSTRNNIVISPTLSGMSAEYIVNLASRLSPTYKIKIVGMPTWETVRFKGEDYKDVDVYYGTPFVTEGGSGAYNLEQFSKKFVELCNARPSDMAYRGYEITLRFTNLYSTHGRRFLPYVNDGLYKVFNDFDFQPVYSTSDKTKIDYMENEKIYFVQKTNGEIKSVL